MTIRFTSIVPILRIFDIAKADEFYVGFLGFKVNWDHRFHDNAPLYRQVSRGTLVLHLSEHHGDGCPGARLRVMMRGVEAFHREISAKAYRYRTPALKRHPGERSRRAPSTRSATSSGSANRSTSRRERIRSSAPGRGGPYFRHRSPQMRQPARPTGEAASSSTMYDYHDRERFHDLRDEGASGRAQRHRVAQVVDAHNGAGQWTA